MKTSTESVSAKRTSVVRSAIIGTLVITLICFEANAISPTPIAAKGDAALKQQIAELQEKVKNLQSSLAAQSPQPVASAMPSMNSSPTSGMPGRPGMTPKAPVAGSGAMKMGDMGMEGMGDKKMGGEMMDMMGMNAMPAASPGMTPAQPNMPQSALPGFPGVSHLYHIGATGFFIEHAQHINLTADQQTALNKMKEDALAAKTNSDHQIEQAEQELGTFTSSDQPDAAKIETKVREIEKLRVDERISFIRAVGEAAKLLTDDQRKILTGAMQPAMAPSPAATMSPMEHM